MKLFKDLSFLEQLKELNRLAKEDGAQLDPNLRLKRQWVIEDHAKDPSYMTETEFSELVAIMDEGIRELEATR